MTRRERIGTPPLPRIVTGRDRFDTTPHHRGARATESASEFKLSPPPFRTKDVPDNPDHDPFDAKDDINAPCRWP